MNAVAGLSLATALLSVLVPSAAAGQTQSPPGPRTCYVVFLNLGPKWDVKLSPMQQAGVGEHAAYMARLTKEGKLLVGGPFVEKAGSFTATGAVLILAADSLEAARAIEENDPAIVSGLMSIAEIRPLLVFAGTWPSRAAGPAPGDAPSPRAGLRPGTGSGQ